MTTSGNKGKTAAAVLAQQLIAGTQKHFANVSSLTFGSATHTPSEVQSSLQALVNLRDAVESARTATEAKVAAEKAQTPALRSLMSAYVSFVRASFSQSPDVLADFGLKPRKATTALTVEEKATATARRTATRAARHTMGTTQKKKVKGTVTTIVTPTPSPASPPVSTGPAASAPPPGTSTGATPHGA